ncbi:hypothetical protein EYZ11_004435 [Aspergillus tanneri]|uniref:Inhibitor I9 domain-containing protein n=1 Tax=Aspergillus tanneri TaxID=1220188 RepID=A0A4S3JKT6_9EURO|nr:uncharacterized protein ATNIH1004_002919 [Aspergillus tanneri]KAA8650237.1 hypothetical protein ATNIH1004_002919 [Aspergillus tanneri]THC96062.1 hypothetical protein EYZ11_004435 [Aspergillus tanneri]
MPKYILVIQYDGLDAYEQHGSNIEKITKDILAERRATDQTLFISTRSLPPTHTTSFFVPDALSLEQLKEEFPEGVIVDVHQEA